MALQFPDYQSYIFDPVPTCGKCDMLFYPVGDYYPVEDGLPAFQVKLGTVGDNLFENPDIATSATDWALDNFEYNDGALCLNNQSDTFVPSARQTVTKATWADEYHKIQFSYINQGFPDNPFTIKLEIRDSTDAIVETVSISPNTTLTGKEITLYWLAPNTAETDYTFIFYMIFDNTYAITQTTGFCFDDFSLYLLDRVTSVSQDFLSSVDVALSFTEVLHNGNALIELSGLDVSTNDCMRLKIISESEVTYYTNYFKLDIFGECAVAKQILITWTDDCRFGELDYANLPFVNSLYVKGYVTRLPNATRERIQRINGDGTADTVYNSSYGKVQVGVGAYTADLHDILARAFEHKTVTINGESYTLDESSSYTTADLRNGLYSARIDLILVGKEVVKTLCCC